MALCLADSLIEQKGFDPIDQLDRYVRWYHTGYLASNGRCFDIGISTAASLHRFERTHEPYPGSTAQNSAGNGSLMRLAPVPMFYACQPRMAIEKCADSSRTTHANLKAVDACRYFGAVLVGALNGQPKQVLLLPPQDWEFLDAETKALLANLEPDIAEVAGGSYKRESPPEIQGGGYVVHALEAALWVFYQSSTFKEGVLMAANLGDDADTTAAIFGQLAGTFYGEQGIPEGWRGRLAMVDMIIGFADKLFDLSWQGRVSDPPLH